MNKINELLISIFVLFLTCASLPFPVQADASKTIDNSASDMIELGRKIYQDGELGDGSPVKAIVLGDIEVTGDQFTCLNCHRRSGLGGPEGTKYVLATNGGSLLVPRVDLYMERPAYTYETFAEAMTLGVNPKGTPFDPIMPIYDLPEPEMRALFGYLKTLSNKYSPGVNDVELHIATVVSKDIDPQLKNEMLQVLNAFIDNKNAQTRHEKKRYTSGPFYHEYRNKAYRQWVLHIWEVSGPAESWAGQLETYYQQQPVFAMISGVVSGDWNPIHNFSREKKLPCLLPNTDLPTIGSPADFYTLYFSKGLTLEAQTLHSDLAGNNTNGDIVQIYRQGTIGEKGAQASEKVARAGKTEIINLPLVENADWQEIKQKTIQPGVGAVVLWLGADDLEKYAEVLGEHLSSAPVYVSSSLLNGEYDLIPPPLNRAAKIIHPFKLKEDQQARLRQLEVWLKQNNISMSNPRIQGQTYFACLLLNGGLKHIKRYYYREFFLDLLDHGERMSLYSINYPRLSFGPEQRFLAKGAYIIDPATAKNHWVIPGH